MAVNDFGAGRCVYISGLPYSFENSRLLYRSILWSAHDEGNLHKWFSTNFNVEVHAYVKNGKYCVVNNTYEPQDTTVYRGDGSSFDLHLDANENYRRYENLVKSLNRKKPPGGKHMTADLRRFFSI